MDLAYNASHKSKNENPCLKRDAHLKSAPETGKSSSES